MALNREAVIRAAEKYVSKGKLEAAIKEYRKVLAENPNDANTLNRVGDLYARTERFGEAVKLFTQIAEQYTRDGFFVKAIAIYKKIIKLDPTSLPVYERLAELYFKQGLLNEARTQYQVLADYYQKHDNATSAITIYQKMAEMEPENPAFHLKLAELYGSQRLQDKALSEYRQLANLLIVNGSVDEAAQVYLKAFQVEGDHLDFVREAVLGLHDGGHVGAAARVLSGAVERYPEAASLAAEISFKPGPEEPAGPEVADLGEPEPAEPDLLAEDASFAGAPEPEPLHEEGLGAQEGLGEPVVDLDETDETHVAPEVSFADAEAAVAELASFSAAESTPEADADGGWSFDDPGAFQETPSFQDTGSFAPPADLETGEEEVFTFDLEDDDVPDTLVEPPADMLEEPDLGPGFAEDAGGGRLELDGEAAGEDGAFEVWEPGGLDTAEPVAAADPIDLGSLDLEPLEELAVPAAAADEHGEHDEPEEITLELDGVEVELEGAAAEDTEDAGDQKTAGPPSVRREEDLLAEARVFAKYGLQEKALDRLGELIDIRPDHLEGLELRTRIHLDAGRQDDVIAGANEVARVALAIGRLGPWSDLRDDLVKAGYSVDDGRVTYQPGEKPAEDDRIAQLLEDLSLEDFDLGSTPTEALPAETSPAEIPDEALPVETPAAEEPLAAAGEPEAADEVAADAGGQAASATPSLVEQLGLGDLQDGAEEPAGAPDAGAPSPETPASEEVTVAMDPGGAFDESGMSWLDDVGDSESQTAEQAEALFDEEDDFFDLAAELERELTEDELAVGQSLEPQEQSLEDIIEGFKQGVAENLSPEDYETHYNLGIAYREMGLLDEAIGEFQLAAKDERYTVDCSSLLGNCFLEKGLPELAVRWYRKGLESPAINDEATAGLLYDMGDAYLALGDSQAAYKTFVEIYGLNSNYRDVSAKLEALGSPDPAV